MKTVLKVMIAATAMMIGAGLANATVSHNVAALGSISSPSAQTVTWWRYHHRRCWWHHGHRHCR